MEDSQAMNILRQAFSSSPLIPDVWSTTAAAVILQQCDLTEEAMKTSGEK